MEQLHISIELGPRFSILGSSEQKLMQESLSEFTEQLVSDLSLPVQPSIEISLASNSETNDFTAKINDQPCRLPLPTKLPEQSSTRELANYLAAGIYQNRELCLSPSVSEKLWIDWVTNDLRSEFSREEFHELLLDLIRRGFRIDRFKQGLGSELLTPESLVEKALSGAARLKLYLSKEQAGAIAGLNLFGTNEPILFSDSFAWYQQMLFDEMGVVLPGLTIETEDRLQGNEFQFQINDLRQPPVSGLGHEEILVSASVAQLAALNISSERAVNPYNGIECAMVRGADARNACSQSNVAGWGPGGFIILHLAKATRSHTGALLTFDLVEFLMRELERDFPALVKVARTRYDAITTASILRDLVDEDISIRDLPTILEGLLAIEGATRADLSNKIVFFPYTLNLCQLSAGNEDTMLQPKDYSNEVRTFLKRYISNKYTRGQSSLNCYLLDREIEGRLNRNETEPLTAEERSKLIDRVLKEAKYSPTATPVILTTIEIRRVLRKLLEKEFPWLYVLSYQELSRDLNIQPLARIS